MGTCVATPPRRTSSRTSDPRGFPKQVEEILRRLNRVRIQRQNDIADEETAGRGRTLRRDGGDEQTGFTPACVGRARRTWKVGGQANRLAGDAEIATLQATVLEYGRSCFPRDRRGITTVVPRMRVDVMTPSSAPVVSTSAPPANPSCIGAVVRST